MLDIIKYQIEYLKESTLQGRLSAGIIKKLEISKNLLKGMQVNHLESSVLNIKEMQKNFHNISIENKKMK